MIKFNSLVLNMKSLLFIFLVALLFSCGKTKIKEPLPLKTNDNLTYFGYTLIDVFWDDPSDKEDKTNYLDEIQDFSNLADILVIDPTENIVERIDNFENSGVQSVLHLNEMFFEQISSGGNLSGTIYGLRSDYQERWDTFVTTNNINGNATKIAALYIGEEPAWNGISEVDFTAACDYAKATVPNIPIFNVESYAAIDNVYTPNSVDWVGFNHYFIPEPSTNSTYQAEYNTMKQKMKPHQKIVLIMDAHWIKNFHGASGISKNDMDFVARDFYSMANADTNVVGVFGYFWPSGFDVKNSVGIRHLPQHVIDEHITIGKAITGK